MLRLPPPAGAVRRRGSGNQRFPVEESSEPVCPQTDRSECPEPWVLKELPAGSDALPQPDFVMTYSMCFELLMAVVHVCATR